MVKSNKIRVTYFQRKPIKGFSFSFEAIFEDIRNRLKNDIIADTKISSFGNGGIFTKIGNIIEAGFRQSKSINHITGEIHFLDFLMRKKTVVLTIHDCGPMVRKKGLAKTFVLWLYLKAPIAKAKIVTTVSEETKKEILTYINCNPDKIQVIPVAVNEKYRPSPKMFNTEKPVILQIGTGPNKNVMRLVEALKNISCHLIIVGKIKEELKKTLSENKIEFSNFVGLPLEELIEKYKQSDIVSFVSTFEGFGMPIVEANCVERVVVTSNISSMPEVAASAACLVDPYDVNAIRVGFLKVIKNKEYREELIKNGIKNKERFDPQKIANSYLDIYIKMTESL